jgi:hypothetical protein
LFQKLTQISHPYASSLLPYGRTTLEIVFYGHGDLFSTRETSSLPASSRLDTNVRIFPFKESNGEPILSEDPNKRDALAMKAMW